MREIHNAGVAVVMIFMPECRKALAFHHLLDIGSRVVKKVGKLTSDMRLAGAFFGPPGTIHHGVICLSTGLMAPCLNMLGKGQGAV